jgi:60 kDa SS-A/Ro ribonucleoprotein
MSIYGRHYATRVTPQSQPIPGKPMVANSAGGYSFAVDKWARLARFLTLGAEGGSYYATERELVIENCEAARECLAEDAARAVRTVVEVSDAGRAPRNDPAIFVLAMAAGLGHTALAMEALPKVCRTATHLFQFAEAVQKFRGWGRGLRKGIAAWYTGRDADSLAYQLVKYQSRGGWSHRDLLRLAHPVAPTPAHDAAFRWAVGGLQALPARTVKRGEAAADYPALADHLPRLIAAAEEAKTADADRLITLIVEHDLPRECIPTEHLNSPAVWDALLLKMPLTAMVRNLAKMTAIGLIKPLSSACTLVSGRLADQEYIRKSRLHPLALLIAAKTYASGHGLKGSLRWQPVAQVNDALDGAFYLAFGNVEPAGKRTLIGLDVSGSMAGSVIAGSSLTAREGAAAFAMVTAKTEPAYHLMAFSRGFVPLDISACSRLTDVLHRTSGLPFDATDCALPVTWALARRLEVDTFIVLTDSETWYGAIHPVQALRQYREQTGIPAKLIVVGMVANGFTIADPSDPGTLDVVGFDASAPAVISGFSAGRF